MPFLMFHHTSHFKSLAYIGLFGLLFSIKSLAQDSSQPVKTIPIVVSYFSHEYIHPGLKLGTEHVIHQWGKAKNSNRHYKPNRISLHPQLAFNVHYENHSVWIANLELSVQHQLFLGWHLAYSLGIGNLRHLNWGTTYELQDDGSLEAKRWASRSYFLPNVNAEIGKRINSKCSAFSKITAAARTNYNTIPILPQVYWEIGIKIHVPTKSKGSSTSKPA